jgi:sporulation protein YlmC with PRC-barrel domain
MAVNKNENRNLFRLKELDNYKVASSDPDVRGWDVISSDGTKIGNVDELIVDPQVETTRYLDVKVDETLESAKEDHHLLIPIGAAKVHEKKDEVLLEELKSAVLLNAPPYTGNQITRDYEDQLRTAYWPERRSVLDTGNRYYEDDLYSEEKFYGSRRSLK